MSRAKDVPFELPPESIREGITASYHSEDMNRLSTGFAALLALPSLALAAGLRPPVSHPASPSRPASPSSAIAKGSAAVRLRSLTLHDRIAQMLVIRGYGDYPPSDDAELRRFEQLISRTHVGGFIIAGRIRDGNVLSAQPFELAAFVNHIQHLAKTPLLVGSDFERGASMRVSETAKFPYMMAFGAAGDLTATRRLGLQTAREARAMGVNWIFAPDADVNNNPDNPIINTRSFGEDPNAVANHVAAFVEGAHSDPARYVLVSAKHFPGHGDTSQDTHLQMAVLNQPKERLQSLELVPFRAAIAHGADSVMTAHLDVPALEPAHLPATLSHNVLTTLLREELGFKGLIVTDALEMQGVTSLFPPGEAAVRAVEAGADVLLMPPDPDRSIAAIEAAITHGRLTRARIDSSVLRILAAKQSVGLFRPHAIDPSSITDNLAEKEGNLLAQQVADRAFTVVKDEAHLFPIPAAEGTCLVVIGEGAFSQRGEVLWRELHRHAHDMKAYILSPTTPPGMLAAVAADVSHCQRIYIAAFSTVTAGRGTVSLDNGLSNLLGTLAQGPVPAALISFGNPYLLRDVPKIPGYAATFSVASTSELSAAKILSGQISATGHMPVSIPGLAKVGDGLAELPGSGAASNKLQ